MLILLVLLWQKLKRFFKRLLGLPVSHGNYYLRAPKVFSGTAKAVVLHCVDPRFRRAIGKYFDRIYGKYDWDPISLPGATKSGRDERSSFILEDIRRCVEGHQASEIVLINHLDCLVYKLVHNSKSVKEEITHHLHDLKAFELVLKTTFPGKKIVLLFVRHDPKGLIFINTLEELNAFQHSRTNRSRLIAEPAY